MPITTPPAMGTPMATFSGADIAGNGRVVIFQIKPHSSGWWSKVSSAAFKLVEVSFAAQSCAAIAQSIGTTTGSPDSCLCSLRLLQQHGRARQEAEESKAHLELRIREATAELIDEKFVADVAKLKAEKKWTDGSFLELNAAQIEIDINAFSRCLRLTKLLGS